MSTVVAFAPEVESVLALKSTRSPEALARFQAAIHVAGRDDAEFTSERLRELLALAEQFQALLLYDQVDFLRGINPSTENLVIAFWNELEPHITAGKLHRVRLYETPRNFADYFGPDAS